MSSQDAELIKKAEKLEVEAKFALNERNYDKAISNFLIAKEIYSQLGLTGQVGILIREIVRIKNLKKEDIRQVESKTKTHFKIELNPIDDPKKDKDITEEKGFELLETARSQALENKVEDALYFYDMAYKLFQKLSQEYECKQILWQINELKEYQRWGDSPRKKELKSAVKDIVALSKAEKRRLKIQSQFNETKKPIIKSEKDTNNDIDQTKRKIPKIFEQMKKSEIEDQIEETQKKNLIELQKEQRIQDLYEREKKLKLLREQKKKEELQITQAQDLLAKGKEMVDHKNYDEAKKYYIQSIELFSILGWKNQVTILQNELRNIDRYKKEDEIKHQQTLLNKVESEKQFQQTVSKALDKQKRLEQIELERINALPIDINLILEKVELLTSKAQKEENVRNFQRALARYEYILSLYNSIPKEIINLSKEKLTIESKINELKAKL